MRVKRRLFGIAFIFFICGLLMTIFLARALLDKGEAPIAERNETRTESTSEGWKIMVPKSDWKETQWKVNNTVIASVTEELYKCIDHILVNVSLNEIVLNNCLNITFRGVLQNEEAVFHFYCDKAPIAEGNEAKSDHTSEGWNSTVTKSGWKETQWEVNNMVIAIVTEELDKCFDHILVKNVSLKELVLNNCLNITFRGVLQNEVVFHFYCDEAPITGRSEARIDRTSEGWKIMVTKSGWQKTLQAVNKMVTENVIKELDQYFDHILVKNVSSNETVLNNCLNITFREVLQNEVVFQFYCDETPVAETNDTRTDRTPEGWKITVTKSGWEETQRAVYNVVTEIVTKELDQYFNHILVKNVSSNETVLNCLNITFRGVLDQNEVVFQFYCDGDSAVQHENYIWIAFSLIAVLLLRVFLHVVSKRC